MLDHAPRLSADRAAKLARELYGIDGTATALTSERDQNFLVTGTHGERLVLKVANATEDAALLNAQQRAMDHVAARFPLVPRVLQQSPRAERGASMPAAGAEAPHFVRGDDGKEHAVWAITYLPGITMGTVHRRTRTLYTNLGRAVGSLSDALADFDDAAVHRDFYWDLAKSREVIAKYRPLVTDAATAKLVDTVVDRFDRHTAPRLGALRTSVIHNDLNDYNILVDWSGEPLTRGQRVSGFIDFGDMVHGWTIGDLAIAGAYVAIGEADPLTALEHLVRGCNETFPLDEAELGTVFGLILIRLATSVCVAAHQRRERPDNAYLDVSQQAIRDALPRLTAIPFGLAEATFRAACGLEPSARSAAVRDHLASQDGKFAPVLGMDLRTEPSIVLDLSVGGAMVSGDPEQNTEPKLTARVFGAMRDAGVRVSIGRWDEPRLLYITPAFNVAGAEWRTIHLGLDLFAEAGTPVHAPLDGVVHAFHDNATLLDYGPVIILKHTTGDGTEFYTLYGHLSRESLDGLVVGRSVRRAERLGWIGTADVNVGWTPHLHLQVITDLLDLGADFPGVGAASRRDVWRSLSPDPTVISGVPRDRFPVKTPPFDEARAERDHATAHNLRLSYREPIRAVRGWKHWLYDDTGRRYLDAYNNVPHVGHAHPRVVKAAADQMSVLSTNTRYVSDLFNRYAERLSALFPEPLRVAFLLNSASEANELALRLARAHTGARDVIVLEDAYHGNTTTLIDISPYKHAGKGGAGAPDWVHVAPLPDDYRGPHKRGDRDAGMKYAAAVGDIVAAAKRDGRRISAFIAESAPSVGGQIILPPGYLAAAYAHVRAAGGVCIADEVQTGLGRLGTHLWAFEAQGVVPDIVVLGKPLGNGHPIAAVITTRDIADNFDNGMEFFSTFGGNTVSCAVGLAVLDVLEAEKLQVHARQVGQRLLAGLRDLAGRHSLIGDVRGTGFFLGAELVRDRMTLEPATAEAAYVVNRMRELGVLIGTEGRHDNVLKIRPPMTFDDAAADILVSALDRALGEI